VPGEKSLQKWGISSCKKHKKDIDTDTSTKKSHHNQLIITCGKCGQKMRVPKLEKDIKVKCPNPNCCNEFLLKGKAI